MLHDQKECSRPNTAGIQALSSQPSSAREKELKRVRKKVHRGHERPTGQSTKNDDDKNTGTNPTANKESVVDEDPSSESSCLMFIQITLPQ
ncbi:hypothetical protein N7491_000676 [Penicillium cf. griseofulvum]|uniref:Uncharacterized protein n=1 Tax=Penicillium cf. griseofulvum TaxID=2972120 RepID=A0A9W9LWY4_9EURO|nr:hypothetical protein N7472_011081 [Penicillium cf. griseofulvum]KAJ5451494.1 hypothetical protein N7491_000676 [Penicillium cf. griseofulvum]